MNQGNVEKWKGDNGIWQDGGILIHFEKEENGSVSSLPSSHSHGVRMKRDMLAFPLSIVIIQVRDSLLYRERPLQVRWSFWCDTIIYNFVHFDIIE